MTDTPTPPAEATDGRLPERACSPLLVIPKDACNNESLAELKSAGYIVIRTDSPEGVRLITAEMAVDHSDMVMAAMKALCESNANIDRTVFMRELHRRMLAREANAIVVAPATLEPESTSDVVAG